MFDPILLAFHGTFGFHFLPTHQRQPPTTTHHPKAYKVQAENLKAESQTQRETARVAVTC
jgi:hypothetical protein